jgi:hypothetical protein
MGNPMLRSLLVLGATSVLRHVKGNASAPPWLSALLARRPFKVVAVALANKMARIIWALLTKGGNIEHLGRQARLLTLEPAVDQDELNGGLAGQRQGAVQMMNHRDEIPMQERPCATMRSQRV